MYNLQRIQFQLRFKNERNIFIFDLIYRLQDIFQLPHAIIVVISTKNKTFQKKKQFEYAEMYKF